MTTSEKCCWQSSIRRTCFPGGKNQTTNLYVRHTCCIQVAPCTHSASSILVVQTRSLDLQKLFFCFALPSGGRPVVFCCFFLFCRLVVFFCSAVRRPPGGKKKHKLSTHYVLKLRPHYLLGLLRAMPCPTKPTGYDYNVLPPSGGNGVIFRTSTCVLIVALFRLCAPGRDPPVRWDF